MEFLKKENSSLDKTFLVDDQRALTYRELFSSFKNFNFNNRDLFLLISENKLEIISFYYYCLYSKNVPILVNADSNNDYLKNIIEKYSPEYICCDKSKKIDLSVFHNYSIELELDETLILKKNYHQKNKIHEDLAILLTSSGTTGDPKLVKLSYDNIDDNTLKISKKLNLTSMDIPITTLPLSYTYGLSVLNTHFCKDCKIILNNDSIISRNFWRRVSDFKPNSISGVPYTFEILNSLGLEKLNLKSFKKFTQAGGKMNDSLKEKIYNFCTQNDIELFIMYGQVEATARISILDHKLLSSKFKSVGNVLDGGEIDIIKKNYNDHDGEIVYSGKNIFIGYANCRKDLKIKEENKILKTGDMGYLDKDGYLYITGRKKRFIKMMGNSINLDQLENQINKKGFKVVVTGKDDALIIAFEDKNINLSNLKKYFLSNFKINLNYVNFLMLDQLPLTSNKKIDYKKIEYLKID